LRFIAGLIPDDEVAHTPSRRREGSVPVVMSEGSSEAMPTARAQAGRRRLHPHLPTVPEGSLTFMAWVAPTPRSSRTGRPGAVC